MYVDNFDWIHINVDNVNCSILINEKGCGFQSNFSLWRIRITKYLFFTEKLSFVKIKIKLLYLKFSSQKILSGTEVFFRIQDPSLFFLLFTDLNMDPANLHAWIGRYTRRPQPCPNVYNILNEFVNFYSLE